jgi:phenylacetate-CoA ligase
LPTQRGENLLPTEIVAPDLELEPTTPKRVDELTVRVECVEGISDAIWESARQQLIERIKVQIGTRVEAVIVAPGSLERSAGKLKRLYDLR